MKAQEYIWIIDLSDSTLNFSKEFAMFGGNDLCLVRRGEVLFRHLPPALGEFFFFAKRGGIHSTVSACLLFPAKEKLLDQSYGSRLRQLPFKIPRL